MLKKTKIVATLGPVSCDKSVIIELIKNGANVFRLNFSHGTHESHAKYIEEIRKASEEIGEYVGILGDLCGPKIRVGKFAGGPVELKVGDKFFLSEDPDEIGTKDGIGTSYPYLTKDVKVGSHVLLDDGNITLEAEKIEGNKVYFKVIDGGILKEHKGMNMPGITLSVPTITEKDKDDLKFIVEHKLDFVALSFVRKASDIRELRELAGDADIRIIAKIEKPEAVDELEEILDVTDAIMIARGDLGVEIPIQEVPAVQKFILERCSRRGVTVITATQMLESMIENQRPTRAETTDVFNAILEGSDAVMLSGETASGHNPAEAVKMMSEIAIEAEKIIDANNEHLTHLLPEVEKEIEEVVAHSACEASVDVNAKAIVAYTHSGNTALNISKYHSPTPVVALTPFASTCRRLALSWGIHSVIVRDIRNTDDMLTMAEETLKEEKIISKGDILVIVAGVPLGVKGNTNMVKLHKAS